MVNTTNRLIFKVYVFTQRKGITNKGEGITVSAIDRASAEKSAIAQAKTWYGYRGKVHIASVWQRDGNKQYIKLD